jgi:D-beta-D-heptose 7-phosphate kinase/D-beta-D-heptose 1-phosphate adenosyltransferase
LIEILEGFSTPRIVLAGDFMLDEYVYGDVERISPEAPVPVLRVDRREYRSGGAGNAAAMMASLGASVECAGIIGRDRCANILVEQLKERGADTSGLMEVENRPTIVKTRYVGLAQHKNPHQILRVDEEKTDPMDAELQDRIASDISGRLEAGGNALLAIQDHDKGLLGGGLAQKIIADAREKGIEVVVDPAPNCDFNRYCGASVITPNRFEASRASGIEITDRDTLEAAAARLMEIVSVRTVLITLDREGAFLLIEGAKGEMIPAQPRAVYDGTGAGDAVMAMISLATAEGCDPAGGAALANVAGGLEVERFGVVPLTREEVAEEIRSLIGLRRSKVVSPAWLAGEVRRRQREGQRVVFTNGCFDLLHLGHVTYLQQAREEGTCLIVAINSDDSVRRLKGESRPIISQDERASMLGALECVDYVVIFEEDTPERLLSDLRPDMLVKGGTTPEIVGRGIVEGYGGEVKHLGRVEGLSTTQIINRIVEDHNG